MSGAATPGAVPEPSDASEPVRQPAATADPLRIAARTSIAARSADPAWRPRLLLSPSPRPQLIVLATLPQQLGSWRSHMPRVLAGASGSKLTAQRLLRAAPPTHVPIASRAPK